MIAGIDEVGRGSLAGPIISVAALFRSRDVGCSGICDSKKLNGERRQKLFRGILWSSQLVDFGLGQVEVHEIDYLGIDRANTLSFERAVAALPYVPELLFVDGTRRVPGFLGPQYVEPKADNNYEVVGAASILAKVIRDQFMIEMAADYPHYDWHTNMGYGSKSHREAIKRYGPSPLHRRDFIRKITSTLHPVS